MTKKKSVNKKKQEPKEEDQNKFLQLQMLDQQMKQIQQYIQTFDQQLLEIRSVIDSLKELTKLKKGDPILAPIASGIFIKAKLEDNKDVRVNVGNNTVVTKTIEQAIKMLEGQEKEINQYRSETLVKFDEMIKKAESLQE